MIHDDGGDDDDRIIGSLRHFISNYDHIMLIMMMMVMMVCDHECGSGNDDDGVRS
jgi:hypothetical protein